MFRLFLSAHPQPFREPFSRQTLAKTSRLRGATVYRLPETLLPLGCIFRIEQQAIPTPRHGLCF
jgi:hypothetical protein